MIAGEVGVQLPVSVIVEYVYGEVFDAVGEQVGGRGTGCQSSAIGKGVDGEVVPLCVAETVTFWMPTVDWVEVQVFEDVPQVMPVPPQV